MKEICSVDGCDNNAISKLLCNKHYLRLINHGDVNHMTKAAKGEGTINHDGYRYIQVNGIKIFEHRIVAEKALGKPLPKGAIVHHVNGDKLDNRTANLVICQDQAYHFLLHARTESINAGYPAYYRKCKYCGQYDNPEWMAKNRSQFYHKKCINKYTKQRYHIRKSKDLLDSCSK